MSQPSQGMGEVSGSPIAGTVMVGTIIGNVGVLRRDGQNIRTRRTREAVLALSEFAAFVANSLVFLLIGLWVGLIPCQALGAPKVGRL